MPATLCYRMASYLALTTLLAATLLAAPDSATFPALNDPPSTEMHPGKFAWADLFTTDSGAATKFYTSLLGWTSTDVEKDGRSYTVFSNGGHPVAGLVQRKAGSARRPSRWIGYIAVGDIDAALAAVSRAGGKVRAPARDFPDRGRQAIVTDNEGSPVGLLQSKTGDCPDDEPRPGDWNWFELYVGKPKSAAGFYGEVFKYDVKADDRTARKNDFLLICGDESRAGVAPLPDREDSKPGWLGVVRVADIDEAVAKATSLGGEVLVAPRPVAYESRFAIIADPTGGTIGLVQYVDNANPANRQ